MSIEQMHIDLRGYEYLLRNVVIHSNADIGYQANIEMGDYIFEINMHDKISNVDRGKVNNQILSYAAKLKANDFDNTSEKRSFPL